MSNLKDMGINTNGKITSDVRKQLMLIIEREFTNKESLYHQAQEREKRKIIEAYQKDVGYDGLKKALDRAEAKKKEADDNINKAVKAIHDIGLDTAGQPDSTSEYDYKSMCHVSKPKAIKLAKLLEVCEKNAPSNNLKAKLITRLMLATTIGEANAIMFQVLGNGILQDTDVKSITFQE